MSENLPRGILLVEEYGALGVAISSALRKFAPLHRVEIAHSFAEAEVAAARMRPELFVLDLDPPPSGEIEFLSRLKTLYPEARSLVIAAGTSRELRAERGTAGAIQFVEKPFDLAEFGAAVQALVGPWTGPPGTVRGTLRDLGIIDIVQLKCLANSNTAVRIEMPDDHQGEIHFQKGQITHAESGSLVGVAALEQILAWSGGQMNEQDLPAAAPRTIDRARDELLLPALRKIAAQKREASAPSPVRPQQPEKSGPRILVIDDTEMLLIFVADVLATADQTFQIKTASSGEAGVKLAIETRPDLVLLDYSLADMTGDKVCRALLDDERTARTPVLMMSGHPTELARTAAGYKNVVSTLPKPFLSGALINAVEKTLAAGPLPKAIAFPKPAAASAPAPPTVKDERKPLSSNGHAPGSDGPSAKTSIVTETVVEEVASLTSPPVLQPPKPMAVPATGPPPSGATADVAPVARATALRLTFSLEVVALRLTSSLQMD
ncbi:MAG TPA: response regulator, partial [Chthoniobacterales bacterium]